GSVRLIALTCFSFAGLPSPRPSTLSLHDALPISPRVPASAVPGIKGVRLSPHGTEATLMNISASGILVECVSRLRLGTAVTTVLDRKSTRLNSSHDQTSYAVFCLKKQISTPALSP